MQPAIAAVVDNHVQTRTTVVIEGDYVIPGAITGRGVAIVLIDEDDLEQLTENYVTREPHRGAQRERATASVTYGRWLKDRAHEAGVAVVAARPWDSVLVRLTSALDAQ